MITQNGVKVSQSRNETAVFSCGSRCIAGHCRKRPHQKWIDL